MKFNIIVVTILLSYISCYAQQITKGDIHRDRQYLIDKRELTAIDSLGNFVSIRPHLINRALNNYFVEFYDNLNFEERIEVETKKETDILKVFWIDDEVHVLIKEERKKTISLIVNSVNSKTKEQQKRVLYSVQKEDNKDIYKALKNNFYIALDVSSEIRLSFPYSVDKKNRAFIKFFSKEFLAMGEFDIEPADYENFKNVSYLTCLKANNKHYAIFQLNNTLDDNFYNLIEFNVNGTISRSLKIPITEDSHELINPKIHNNQLIITGLYSNKKKGGYKGFTYYRIDLNSFEIISKQNPFYNPDAEDYFNGLFTRNRSIDINNVFINDNMDTYIVGQFYIMRKQTMPIGIPIASFAFAGGSIFITYNPIHVKYKVYDDMLTAKLDSTGTLKWDKVLNFRQTEKISSRSNKRDSSTFPVFIDDEINILMNGKINRYGNQLKFIQDKRPNKTNFYRLKINEHGGLEPMVVFSNADSEILFRTEDTTISNDHLYILGQGNMRKQLLKLAF